MMTFSVQLSTEWSIPSEFQELQENLYPGTIHEKFVFKKTAGENCESDY